MNYIKKIKIKIITIKKGNFMCKEAPKERELHSF